MFSQLKLPARMTLQTVTLTLMTWVMSAFFAISTLGLTATATWASRSPEFGTVYIGPSNLPGSTSGSLPGTAEPVIRVAHDGTRWSTILNTNVKIGFAFAVEMDKGYIIDIFLGRGAQRGGEEVDDRYVIANFSESDAVYPFGRVTTASWYNYLILPSNPLIGAPPLDPGSIAGMLTIKQVDIDGIVAACNNQGLSEDTEHTTSYSIPISMQVDGRSRKSTRLYRRHRGKFKRKLVSALLPVRIECEAPPSMIQAPPKPYSVDLRVTQQGVSCPKRVEVRAFIKYRRPATAKFRFKVNGKLSELVEIRARKLRPQQGVPGNTYLVERVKYYNLDPGQTNFRIEVRGGKKSTVKTVRITCPPFDASGMWMSVKQQNKATCPKNVNLKVLVNANRPGSVLTRIKNQAGVVMAIESVKVRRKGDYYEGVWKKTFNMREIDTQLIAENTNDTGLNSGWQLLKVTCLKTLKGTLTLQDPEGNKCPRKGRIAMAIQTSVPDKVGYRLKCNGGWQWSGKLDAQQTAPGTYLAVGVKSFKIKKNVRINCALKTVADGQWKTVALQGRKFQCIGRPVAPGASGITTTGNPQSARKIRCRGGKVRGKRCICKAGTKRQKVGKNAFRCVKPAAKISCQGGKVSGNRCRCGAGKKRQKIGKKAFVCVKKPTRIKPTRVKCIGGKVRNGQCKCRRKKVLVNGRCIRPAG